MPALYGGVSAIVVLRAGWYADNLRLDVLRDLADLFETVPRVCQLIQRAAHRDDERGRPRDTAARRALRMRLDREPSRRRKESQHVGEQRQARLPRGPQLVERAEALLL